MGIFRVAEITFSYIFFVVKMAKIEEKDGLIFERNEEIRV